MWFCFWFVGGLHFARILRGKATFFVVVVIAKAHHTHKSGFQLELRVFKPIMTSFPSLLDHFSVFCYSAEIHAVLLIVIYVCVFVCLCDCAFISPQKWREKRIDCRRRLYLKRSIAAHPINVAILLLISQHLLFIKRIAAAAAASLVELAFDDQYCISACIQ